MLATPRELLRAIMTALRWRVRGGSGPFDPGGRRAPVSTLRVRRPTAGF